MGCLSLIGAVESKTFGDYLYISHRPSQFLVVVTLDEQTSKFVMQWVKNTKRKVKVCGCAKDNQRSSIVYLRGITFCIEAA